MSTLDSPIPLSELEAVLAWVDTFKLSKPTKKINRDFSDAVLLAEILSVHYPKLVEMHNYPPRNSHALKLNNWMTLNRKVLKKLKLNLCCTTMEQLANAAPGLIERVLIMVRDKIHRDEELNRSVKDAEQNVSSGGSYYEACGDEENVLVVPVKTRVNGILETVQQKVVSYESYQGLKEELKDAKDTAELLKQKVEHLDSLIRLKDERIDELQKQLDRKQARRKEVEAYQNSLAVPFETVQSPVVANILPLSKKSSIKIVESATKIDRTEESKIPIPKIESAVTRPASKPSITEVPSTDLMNVDRIRSDVFKEVEIVDESENRVLEIIPQKPKDDNECDVDSLDIEQSDESLKDRNPGNQEVDEFKDSEQDTIITIEESIHKELAEISNHKELVDISNHKELADISNGKELAEISNHKVNGDLNYVM